MKILADKNISYIYKLFSLNNDIKVCEGRVIAAKNLKDVDILIIRSVTKINQALLADSFIKFVGTVTSGTDHVDQRFLKENGITFAAASGSNAVAVVEYVLTVLFWLAQRDRFFLRDKVVGIVGVGNIGNLLYQRLHSFGVNTILCDPFVSKTSIAINNNWKSLEKLVSEADILTLHTPLTYKGNYPTWHMIDIDVLDALSSNTILINTCRGSVIDNSALLRIFQRGKKLSVVLDVWESEPKLSIPLLSYVDIGTPHIAGYTLESKIRGVIYIYNEYCKSFNIANNINEYFLSFPIFNNINVENKVDEIYLYRLIKNIYNICFDDIMLRYLIVKPEGFDALRRQSMFRREWSSLHIKTYLDYNYEILTNLGFNINFL